MIAITARHVLFDLDGTLVDNPCCRRVLLPEGLYQNARTAVPGRPTCLPIFMLCVRPRCSGLVAPERADELYEAYGTNYPLCADQVRVFDGAKDLIRELIGRMAAKPSLVTNKGIERTLIDLSVAGIAPEDFVAICHGRGYR